MAPLHPAGQGAVTLLRVSGPATLFLLNELTQKHQEKDPTAPPPRLAQLKPLWDGELLLESP